MSRRPWAARTAAARRPGSSFSPVERWDPGPAAGSSIGPSPGSSVLSPWRSPCESDGFAQVLCSAVVVSEWMQRTAPHLTSHPPGLHKVGAQHATSRRLTDGARECSDAVGGVRAAAPFDTAR
jgi:hypothetical protein